MTIDRLKATRAGCAVAVLLSIVALPIACAFQMGYLPVRSFDALMWRESSQYSDTARVEMVDSLIRSRRLDGLSKAQVMELLGQPSDDGYFDEWDMVYRLGSERGLFRIDSEWLVIRLGVQGRVSEYRIQRD